MPWLSAEINRFVMVIAIRFLQKELAGGRKAPPSGSVGYSPKWLVPSASTSTR